MKIYPFYMVILLLGVSTHAPAESVSNTIEDTTRVQNTTINSTTLGNAQDWGLSAPEWDQYQKLMRGPNGLWYPKLSPPEVLGLNAQTAQDQKHFAEVVARTEHDKLARELSFDYAIHQALLRLYPTEPIIRSFDMSAFSPIPKKIADSSAQLQTGDHLVLFIDPTQGIDPTTSRLIDKIKNKIGVSLDIFCVGSVDDNAIQKWARLNSLPADLVAQSRITLNRDNGKLQKTAGQVKLPYLLLVRNGESKPVLVGSL